MTTKLDPAEIHKQANLHDETRNRIDGTLSTLRSEVESLLQNSGSAATAALNTTTNNWIDTVKKSVLDHMTSMATAMRNEADGQDFADQESMDEILNLNMDTGSFLGVTIDQTPATA
jgi:hypothetical protein